ncbi:MAG: hypothetical protein J7M25_05725 [Deltaproteobacteria bacterium]|nr:hypothetical protein [Deltaproteobacteria bacterium]
MLETLWELGQNISGAGVALAGKALSSVMELVRDVALKVEEHTGLPVPFGAPVKSWEQPSSTQTYDEGGRDPFHDEVGEVVEQAVTEPVKATTSAGLAAAVPASASKDDALEDAKTTAKRKTAPKKQASGGSKAQARKAKKGKGAAKTKKRAGTGGSQILRLLGILAEDPSRWMSAGELSAATDRQGNKILPGNVRKAIRLRGEGLIEMRPREGSRRGAMEYRATKDGLAQVKG